MLYLVENSRTVDQSASQSIDPPERFLKRQTNNAGRGKREYGAQNVLKKLKMNQPPFFGIFILVLFSFFFLRS